MIMIRDRYISFIFMAMFCTRLYAATITVYGEQRVYNPDSKHFSIIIPTYNNQEWCVQNLRSVLEQEYDNFDIIIIDDCSSDMNIACIEECLCTYPLPCIVTLICNDARYGPAANRYQAIHRCDDDAILIFLDGDDFLANHTVLNYLNTVYQDDDVWMTYGQYIFHTSSKRGWTSEIPSWVKQYGMLRNYGWVCGHLRTARAWLAHQVKLIDLWFDGTYVPMATDVALFMPMLEKSGYHTRYCSEVLCVYNDNTSLNMSTVNPRLQRSLDKIIRARPAYAALEQPILSPSFDNCSAVMLILSYGDCAAVERLIGAAQQHLMRNDAVHIVYHTNDRRLDAQYQALHDRYHVYCTNLKNYVKDGLEGYVAGLDSEYVLCADDTATITAPLDTRSCMQLLEQTGAYGFYTSLTWLTPDRPERCNYIGNDLWAWQFAYGTAVWYHANSLNMVLYRKDILLQQWRKIPFRALPELRRVWSALHMSGEIGLFHA